jgi:class 3 adenylate cyclase
MRECITPEAAQAALAATNEFNVTELLPQLRTPTLVLHRRQLALPPVSLARGLASRIPNARLVVLEGTSMAPYLGDMEAVLAATEEFLGDGEEAEVGAAEPPREAGALATILFTDMEGSTSLTQRLGDAKAQELLRIHNTIVRDALKAHDGSEIKHTGDGIMASFSSATRALECAIAMQRAFADYNAQVGAQHAAPLHIRIGLNAGEPVAEEQDLFGTAVQLARRICDRADPGRILVANVVRELAAGKGFLFADHGDVDLRGFEDPVRLYEVRRD